MAALAPLSSRALYEEVAELLRERIFRQELKPGSWIDELKLAEEYGISRTPLREALKVLAAEGLVTMKVRRGAYVTEVSRQDLSDVYHLLSLLESDAAGVVASKATDAELAEIKAMHYEMLAAFTRRDLPAYYRLNSAIHAAINAAAKNPVLSATYRQVNARLQALRFRSNQDGEKWSAAVKEHEAMVQALDQRDPAAMRAVLLSHLKHKRDVVMAQLHSRSQSGAQA